MRSLLKYCLICLGVLLFSAVSAQDEVAAGSSIYIAKGDKFFKTSQYEAAIKQYQKASKFNPQDSTVRLKIGESYQRNHNADMAAKWYGSVLLDSSSGEGVDPKYLLNYSQVLTEKSKYDEAKYWLERYEEIHGNPNTSNTQLHFLNNLDYFMKDSLHVKIEQSNFSSDKNEYSPFLTKEGILVVSDRTISKVDQTGARYSELLLVKFSDDSVSRAVVPYLKSGRHNYHDGPITMAGNTMIVTRTVNDGKNKDKLRLYISKRDSLANWGDFEPLNLMETGVAEGHPTLSSDAKNLYFVSDADGDKGIYHTHLSDSGWVIPHKLQGEINSQGAELFPYLFKDSVLYFSSNGHAGLGGLDVFRMALSGPDSGQVINVGTPINSSMDDFGICISEDQSYGYLSSNRQGGLGGDDVYKLIFKMPKRIYIEGFTKGGETSSSSNLGNVMIYDKVTKRRLGTSDENGFFKVAVEEEKEYDLALKALDKTGYEINEDYYEISFEGLIKHKIDTSHIVHLIITEEESGDTIFVKDQDDKFTYFILEKEKSYNFQAMIPEGKDIKISDIEFEGFIKGTKDPIIISEMDIVDHSTQTNLFRSDKNGYFHFPMENGREYSLVPQSQVAQKIDIWMEGYLKVPDGEFIPPSLHVQNIKGEKYEFESLNGYFGFATKEGESIEFQTKKPDLEKDYDVAEALHFEGFVQHENTPLVAGKVHVYDSKTNQLLFETDDMGFFSFNMDPDVDYSFLAKKADSTGGLVKIKFDGVVKNERDSMTYANISIVDPETNEEIVRQNMEGFVNFQLEENKRYDVKARSIPIKKDVLNEIELVAFLANDIIKQVLMIETNSGKIFELSLNGTEHYYSDGVVKRTFKKKIEKEVYDLETVRNFLQEEGLTVRKESLFYSIYYSYNSSELNQQSEEAMLRIASFLNNHPNLKMVVSSHADARGSARYNQQLTNKRNQSVIKFLENRSIQSTRIKQVSNGALESLENCKLCTEKDHDQNRRTDFHVISY